MIHRARFAKPADRRCAKDAIAGWGATIGLGTLLWAILARTLLAP